MKLYTLVISEIQHRLGSFVLTVLSVATAVAAFICSNVLLKADDLKTEKLLASRQADVETAGAELEDSMRKITKGLGFNIVVLPKDQDLAELHSQGTPNTTMPETHVAKLAESEIVTINHLLPIVARKVEWAEMKCDVIVTGTRGEVPLAHRALKKPLQDAVVKGTMIVGAEFAKTTGDREALAEGSKVKLLDREFEVAKVHEERGTADDITVWINLEEAQEMLGLQNVVNAILALECNCATVDRLAEIREDIAAILPGTQVIERGPPALARAEARNKAKQTAKESLAAAKTNREAVKAQRTQMASIIVPVIVAITATWIVLLTVINVRQRRGEIGILRAIGLGGGQILRVLLGKAAFAGVLGGVLGIAVGYFLGVKLSDLPAASDVAELRSVGPMLIALAAAPVLSVLAGWLPAVFAAKTDPATVLAGN
ncbi:MAG: ABC transporter permease [Planctomycetaceae bacterium]